MRKQASRGRAVLVVIEMRGDNPAFWVVHGPFDGDNACRKAHDFVTTRRGLGFVHAVSEVVQTMPVRLAPAVEEEAEATEATAEDLV